MTHDHDPMRAALPPFGWPDPEHDLDNVDLEDFLVFPHVDQSLSITCLRKGCVWSVDSDREGSGAHVSLNGILARAQRHYADDHRPKPPAPPPIRVPIVDYEHGQRIEVGYADVSAEGDVITARITRDTGIGIAGDALSIGFKPNEDGTATAYEAAIIPPTPAEPATSLTARDVAPHLYRPGKGPRS